MCSVPKTVFRLKLPSVALLALAISLTARPPLGAATVSPGKPNVLVILTDDQGWGDLSINGNTNLSTPRMDALARSGASFDRFYVSPVCSPTRAEFLTGRYHPRGGVHGVSTGAERLNLDEKTIADAFKKAGYRTGAFGKWHNGTQYPYHPNARGFDEFYGFCSGHWGNYFDPPLDHNGQPVTAKGFIIDDLTDHALAFIETNKDRPFFCYVPFNTPHSPMQVPDRFYAKFKNHPLPMRATNPAQEDPGHTRAALAMCENIDWNVGRLLDRLTQHGLLEKTIVIYFCDNGPNGWRWNGGMKGRKGSTDEGGIRSPLFISWKGQIPAGTRVAQISGAIDLLPTLSDLANIPHPGTKPLDGISLKPLLSGHLPAQWPNRLIFSHWNGNVSVRSQHYRLDAKGKLFDMLADPGQATDVSSQFVEVRDRLLQERAKWQADVLAGSNRDNRPFTVGYPAFPRTELPARDGVAHGGIRRSANAPNCSFFENWKNPDDSITWDIEIATTGKYEITVMHTCPPEAIGAEIELTFQGASLRSALREAHDPPLYGAEHDRVSRGSESLVKNFKPLPLGTVTLPKGRGQLALKAAKIPAQRVADVRSVELTLLP